MISCGKFRPSTAPAIIEESQGGQEVLEREFSECEGVEESVNPLNYVQHRNNSSASAYLKQLTIETSSFPNSFDSLNAPFPLRGSWRKDKAEIMDIVDRHIWSPEKNKTIRLLEYFDMVLLINVAPRYKSTSRDSSAQMMQILVRTSSSNDIKTWKRLHTWAISSGRPCGQKIETPTGVYKFNPSRVHEDYSSNQFRDSDNQRIRMYETMFIYHDYQKDPTRLNECNNGVCPSGVALHGTYVTEMLGQRDSGGCVRVERDNMTCLFNTITGASGNQCLGGGLLNYWGQVPSLVGRNGEADPEYLSSGKLEVSGYKVLLAIFDDKNDKL